LSVINFHCEIEPANLLQYGEDIEGEFTFVSQTGKSVVDYALKSEGLLLDLVDYRVGEEVISCHMPLTIILRMDLG
jgi:hypothetical protein